MTLDQIAEWAVLGIFLLELWDHVPKRRGRNEHDGPHQFRGVPDKPLKFGRDSVFTCTLGCGTKRVEEGP